MSANLKLVYTDSDLQRISIYRNYLVEQGIEAHIVNKKDSMYPTLGSVELYVNAESEDKAIQLLDTLENPKQE
jgi:hypothetical protein